MTISKISVDLRSRTFDIEVPDERIDEVLSRLEKLLQLPLGAIDEEDANGFARQPDQPPADPVAEPAASGTPSIEQTPKRRRGTGKGASRTRSYQLVDLGLTAEQRESVRISFTEKSPTGQNDQVAVLGVK